MRSKFFNRYQAALLKYLKQGAKASRHLAHGMGEEALRVGLKTLDVARLHEQIVVNLVIPGLSPEKSASIIRRAGIFFSEAISPVGKNNPAAGDSSKRLNGIVEMLSQRTLELAASNVELKQEIALRKAVEQALKKSEHHYSKLLAESDRLQEQLRQLSRKILSTQEEERRAISRELHDVIAQTLTGINVRLATLKKEAALNTKGLDNNIARTQRLVEESVNIVHRFARELRPAVLDDLGLIPALHTFMKSFTARTGVRTRLTAYAGVEKFNTAKRTIFYRVAQEALTNVARHANASNVEVNIQKLNDSICMKINDDGKSFQVERVMNGTGRSRLGLLGMRERLEMIGGHFDIESAPGKGTTVIACIPHGNPGPIKRKA